MTERLTKRINERVIQVSLGWALENVSNTAEEDEVLFPAIDKLAHYEDLEEQGNLHIVPKPFWDKIMEHLIKMECPFDHDLKGFNEEDCKVNDGRCRLCWEMALKVGGEE